MPESKCYQNNLQESFFLMRGCSLNGGKWFYGVGRTEKHQQGTGAVGGGGGGGGWGGGLMRTPKEG